MASDGIRAPELFSFDGDLAVTWPLWKQQFEFYLIAKEGDDKDDKVKIGLLLNCLGSEGVRRFNALSLTDAERNVYATVLGKFDAELAGEKRTVFSRYQFWSLKPQEGQQFANYLIDLRQRAKLCEFGAMIDMVW